MASISKSELRVRILQQLGVLSAGETASAEDADVTDDAIDAFFVGELSKIGQPDFATSTIPEWAQDAMRDCVAFRAAHLFGVPAARIQQLSEFAAAGLALLLRHLRAVVPETTRDDLRNRILRQLTALRPGEVSPESHSKIVDETIDHAFAWYNDRGTIGYTATSIPDKAMPWWRDFVAYRVGREIGALDPAIIGLLKQQHDIAMLELDRQLTALNESGTKADLRNKVLQHLGVIGIAERATAAQIELTEGIIDAAFAQLDAHGVITFTANTIPGWSLLPLRDYIAYLAAASFRIEPMRRSELLMGHTMAFTELKKQQSGRKNAAPVKATYF